MAAPSECTPKREYNDQYSDHRERAGAHSRVGQNEKDNTEDEVYPVLPHIFGYLGFWPTFLYLLQ